MEYGEFRFKMPLGVSFAALTVANLSTLTRISIGQLYTRNLGILNIDTCELLPCV